MTVTKPDAADNSRRSANSLQARNTHAADFGSFCRINRKQKQRLNITGRARLPPSRKIPFREGEAPAEPQDHTSGGRGSRRAARSHLGRARLLPSHAIQVLGSAGASPSQGAARQTLGSAGASPSQGAARQTLGSAGASPSQGAARQTLGSAGASPSQGAARQVLGSAGASPSQRRKKLTPETLVSGSSRFCADHSLSTPVAMPPATALRISS